MHSYLVTIVMSDGSQGRHIDLYRDAAAAADRAIGLFPSAARIAIRRLTTVLGGRS